MQIGAAMTKKIYDAAELLNKKYTKDDAEYIACLINRAIDTVKRTGQRDGLQLKIISAKCIEHPAGIGVAFEAREE